ncbi:uncharacterized protein [Ptychodera flava]|uniref:uncharacterized protein isoform X1 n=2 Tax=Ptychodera flava TaxID=63121 RepID=UPI00396A6C9A
MLVLFMTDWIMTTGECNVEFRPVTENEIDRAHEIEKSCFRVEEVIEKDTFMRSHHHTKELFLGCYDNGELVGYILGSRYHKDSYEPESMQRCVDGGKVVCVHTVCLVQTERRKGVGSKLMQKYIEMLRKTFSDLDGIVLVSKKNLFPFYTKLGYKIRGPANITFGTDPRYELWYDLKEQ